MPKVKYILSRNTSIIGGLIIIFFGLYIFLSPSTSALKIPIKDQLAAIQVEDLASAYSYTSKEFQKSTSLDAFKKFVLAHSGLRNNESIQFNERSIQNGIGMVKATLVARGGFTTDITYQLVKERNRWKIESMVLMPTHDEPISDDSTATTAAITTPVVAVTSETTPETTPTTTTTPATTPTPIAKTATKQYQDAVYHYAVDYPETWDYTRAERGITIFFKDDHQTTHTAQLSIQPLTTGDDSVRQSVQQVVDMSEAAMRDKDSSYKLVEDNLLPPHANKNDTSYHGRYLLYNYTADNQSMKHLQVIFFRSPSKALYVIDFIAPVAEFEANLPAVRAMIASFTISFS